MQIPICHISEDVYKTSTDWLNQRSSEALGSFVLWLLDSIMADLAHHQGGAKGAKKAVQQTPSKSQVTSNLFLLVALLPYSRKIKRIVHCIQLLGLFCSGFLVFVVTCIY